MRREAVSDGRGGCQNLEQSVVHLTSIRGKTDYDK